MHLSITKQSRVWVPARVPTHPFLKGVRNGLFMSAERGVKRPLSTSTPRAVSGRMLSNDTTKGDHSGYGQMLIVDRVFRNKHPP
jgi:hypothetical protein